VGRYEILQEGEKHYLVAKDINTSREWINIVASNYLENQKMEIPEKAINTISQMRTYIIYFFASIFVN
jgi:hypothetical protein